MLRKIIKALTKRTGKLKRSFVKRVYIAKLLESVPRDAAILEIGGGYNPRYLRGQYPNVYHLDHGNTEDLRAKYAADPTVADQIDKIQPIDFVFTGTPIETLIPPELKFDVIYGSHVLEHQVDLVGHLQSLEKLLKPGGRVIEMIPDLRTCFDALRYPTVTSDALLVHLKNPPIHQGKQVFDAVSREIDKNHGYLMSQGDFDGVGFTAELHQAYEAMLASERTGQPYTDFHAWTFTPQSFRLLMIELRLLRLTSLVPTYVSSQYGNQFCAVLECGGKDAAAMTQESLAALERERLLLARQLRP
jgi:predicted SAM-dependent methyltransferase